MDKSIMRPAPVYRETRFRQPSPLERKLGLWVDRIGAISDRQGDLRRLRILGQYAVVAVESGTGQCVIAAQDPRLLEAGDVLFLSPEQPVAYAPRQEWFTRWIVWNGPEARILEEMANRGGPVIRQAAAIVQRAFIALTHCIDGETAAAAIERKAILLSMLAELAASRPLEAHTAALAGIVDHIERNLDRELQMTALARMAHLSVPHFRRLFERHTGCAPSKFVAAQRIARAKALLAHGMPIKEVAAQVGYQDPAYFMRVFRKITGEPPGRFVRRMSCA